MLIAQFSEHKNAIHCIGRIQPDFLDKPKEPVHGLEGFRANLDLPAEGFAFQKHTFYLQKANDIQNQPLVVCSIDGPKQNAG